MGEGEVYGNGEGWCGERVQRMSMKVGKGWGIDRGEKMRTTTREGFGSVAILDYRYIHSFAHSFHSIIYIAIMTQAYCCCHC